MTIKPIQNKKTWEGFVTALDVRTHCNASLLQSWNYGEFAKHQSREVFRLGFYQGDELVGAAQLVKITSKRGNYLEAHGGPMLDWASPKLPFKLLKYLKKLSQQEGMDFLRLRPPLEYSPALVQHLQSFGFKLAPMYFPAEHTLILDLTPSEEDLLMQMRKNTRYGIRRAKREGVMVTIKTAKNLQGTGGVVARATTEQIFSEIPSRSHAEPQAGGLGTTVRVFYQLYQETLRRQKFVGYDLKYFQDQVATFAQDNQVAIILAEYQGKVVASAMVFFYADTAYYLHGASISTEPDVHASYAVQWAAIQEAKRRGLKRYDFWGIAPPRNAYQYRKLNPSGLERASEQQKEGVVLKPFEPVWDEEHPRAGITLFKRGFGGQYFRHMPTMDLPLSWRYWPTYVYVKYERWRRGL